MRITNELRAKIDRAFTDQENTVLRGPYAEISAIRAKIAEEYSENLRVLSEDKNYPPELAEALRLAANQARNDNDRAKEEFLIAVSYADGDIRSIKEVFAKYGITF